LYDNRIARVGEKMQSKHVSKVEYNISRSGDFVWAPTPYPTTPMASKPTTRESNKSFNTAAIQNQYSCRSTADVQAEKKAKAAAKKAEHASQAAGAAEVAQLEHAARRKLATQKSTPGKVYHETLLLKQPRKRAGDEENESGGHESEYPPTSQLIPLTALTPCQLNPLRRLGGSNRLSMKTRQVSLAQFF
jgi:hypothetical protein